MDQIPEKIKKLAADSRIYDILEKLGGEFGLNIDQLGELDAEVRRVLLGQSKPQDFTKNVSSLLGVDGETSKAITAAVNAQLFDLLKSELKSEPGNASDFEKYGNLTIEREQPKEDMHPPVTPKDRLNLLEGLENPPPVKYRPAADPLVEHLFNNSTAIPAEEVERAPEKPAGPDPYREPPL